MSYIDFGLSLAGMWFATLVGAIGLIVGVIEAFKRLGLRAETPPQEAEAKQTQQPEEKPLNEDELTTLLVLGAVQAYLAEEKESEAS